MDTEDSTRTVRLYHGTRDTSARAILRGGFRRSKSRSYTGTGICLSASISIAYEYGMYETRGCVLEARLSPTARWTDRYDAKASIQDRDALDDYFMRSGMDAVCTYGGNVWVVWTPSVLVSVRRLSHREAIRRLCAEFDEDGPACGYNAVVGDYASIWWDQEAGDPNLTRFPEHQRELTARLQRFMGHIRSTKVLA
ncbi:hypothetical protein [Ottowia sp.]|uniref:hypothetical protein n=1 Tax=Ottowia sp. TaxID=1898956 RepID=UPI0026266E88|nr:hypothetical protein [Ottowia sp.]